MQRRTCLSALAAAALAAAHLSAEPQMITSLLRHPVKPGLFPELDDPAARTGVALRAVPPGSDARLPEPPSRGLLLLVAFRVPMGDGRPMPWQLGWVRPGADGGEPQRLQLPLVNPPPANDNFQPLKPPPGFVLPPGMVSVGTFWLDVGGLLKAGVLRAGETVTVSCGDAASASLRLPGG